MNAKGGYFKSSCLMEAVGVNHQELVTLLLDQERIDANARNVNNTTALHTACYDGNTEMVRMLLAVPGIDKNIVDRLGRTPLMAAKDQGNEECIKLLEGAALKVKPSRTSPEDIREASCGAKSLPRKSKKTNSQGSKSPKKRSNILKEAETNELDNSITKEEDRRDAEGSEKMVMERLEKELETLIAEEEERGKEVRRKEEMKIKAVQAENRGLEGTSVREASARSEAERNIQQVLDQGEERVRKKIGEQEAVLEALQKRQRKKGRSRAAPSPSAPPLSASPPPLMPDCPVKASKYISHDTSLTLLSRCVSSRWGLQRRSSNAVEATLYVELAGLNSRCI